MSVQNIELVRGEENTIHWLIPEPNMVEIRLLLVTDDAVVIMPQERFVEEGGGTGVYAIFSIGEIEDIDAQNGGATNYILKDTQYDEILFTGSVTLTGEGGGTPAEVVFSDINPLKTAAAIADVPIATEADLVQTTSDNKIYKKNAAGTEWEDFSRDISAEDITHTALLAKIAASTLIPGTYYKITDYASVHTIPGTTDTNTPTAEPLIVLAIAVNKLSPVAFSPAFPQDEIYYEVTNDQAMVPGCTKGYIYRRVDTAKSIDIGFDWRSVKFRRWQISVSTVDATGAVGNYTKGQVVKKTGTAEIYIKLNDLTAKLFTSTSDWKRLEWDDLTYVSITATNWVIGGGPFSITIPCSALYMDYTMFSTAPTAEGVQASYATIYNIRISQNVSDILSKCSTIFFGTIFYMLDIGIEFYKNTIGSSFIRNTISGSCYQLSIGTNCFDNVIGASFQSALIGTGFQSNTFEGTTFSVLAIGANFQFNTVKPSFTFNTCGNDVKYNVFEKGFSSNVVRGGTVQNNTCYNCSNINMSAATIVNGDYPKWWFKTPDGTTKLYYFANTTFAQTLADVTA